MPQFEQPGEGVEQPGDVGLLDPGDLGLFLGDVADEERLQGGQPVGRRQDQADGIGGVRLVRLAPLADDQRTYPLRIDGLQERVEALLPRAVLVLVRVHGDAPRRGVRGRQRRGRVVGTEIDGWEAEQFLQMIHTGHGSGLLTWCVRLTCERFIKRH
ncbi:hypothetical protein GCM10010353_66050 [Streptomyces chryseus]|nr:hypothetical protein GCM10010353_66050 [Streptomyces chryseus]